VHDLGEDSVLAGRLLGPQVRLGELAQVAIGVAETCRAAWPLTVLRPS